MASGVSRRHCFGSHCPTDSAAAVSLGEVARARGDGTAFTLLGQALPWRPISVSPELTWLSLLSLLPPLAIFLGVIQLSSHERRLLSLVVIAAGIFSAIIGLLQVAQGPSSPWRFFAVTNDSEAVGFFANRNHFAALLYCVLVFAAAWAIEIAEEANFAGRNTGLSPIVLLSVAVSFLVLVVLLAAEAMARSRAGLFLTMVHLLAHSPWLSLGAIDPLEPGQESRRPG